MLSEKVLKHFKYSKVMRKRVFILIVNWVKQDKPLSLLTDMRIVSPGTMRQEASDQE